MISQKYKTVAKVEMPAINQCLDVARIKGKDPIIITGGNDNNAYIVNNKLEIIQTMPFNGWVRSCCVFDIGNDGTDEIAFASGDNTLKIFEYSSEKDEYVSLWDYHFKNKVTSVAAADINADGRIEILAGSWDKTVKVFDAETGKILWELEFSDWITQIKTLDVNWDGIPEILICLKKGQFLVINGLTGACIWDHQFKKRITDCDLVSLADNEYPHLILGGEGKITYIFDYEGNLIKKIPMKDLVVSISHGDVSGNGYQEVIIGLANRRIYVYETGAEDDSESANGSESTNGSESGVKSDSIIPNINLKIRWSALVDTIMGMKVFDILSDGIPKIVITGYGKTLKIIKDFHFGKESDISHVKHNVDKSGLENNKQVIRSIADKQKTALIEDEFFFFPTKTKSLDNIIYPEFKPRSEIKELNYSSVQFIEKIFLFVEHIRDNHSKENDLKLLENPIVKVSKESEVSITLKNYKLDDFTKFVDEVNRLKKKVKKSKKKTTSKSKKSNKKSTGKVASITDEAEMKKIIKQNLSSGLIPIKIELQDMIIDAEISKLAFLGLFDELKNKSMTISKGKKSSKKSKGRKKKSSKKSKGKKKSRKRADPVTDEDEIRKIMIRVIRKEEVIAKRKELQELIYYEGVSEEDFQRVFVALKEERVIKYSLSEPKGYSIRED